MPEDLEGQITGVSDAHIDFSALEAPIHREAVEAFSYLKQVAAKEGFNLTLASGFRCFSRQLAIWNAKALGHRPILSSFGEALNPKLMTPSETIYAILRWSALPGASRHHWGCEADVFDSAALEAGEKLQLTLEECEPGGVFGGMHRWLDSWLPGSDFYRPYAKDTGGVSPEPWHISYRPISSRYASAMSSELIRKAIEQSDIVFKMDILSDFDEIYRRFIQL